MDVSKAMEDAVAEFMRDAKTPELAPGWEGRYPQRKTWNDLEYRADYVGLSVRELLDMRLRNWGEAPAKEKPVLARDPVDIVWPPAATFQVT